MASSDPQQNRCSVSLATNGQSVTFVTSTICTSIYTTSFSHAVRRSSEKLDRQIEQLELQLEALQVNDAEIVAAMPEKITGVEAVARSVRAPAAGHLPREVRTHAPQLESVPGLYGEKNCASWGKTSLKCSSVSRLAFG